MESIKKIISDTLLLEELTPEAYTLIYEKALSQGVSQRDLFRMLQEGFKELPNKEVTITEPKFFETLVKYTEDRILSPNEYAFLKQLAKKFKVSDFQLISMIYLSIDLAFSGLNESGNSGFIPREGAATPEEGEPAEPVWEAEEKFSEVSLLSDRGAFSLLQKGKYHGKWHVIKRLKSAYASNVVYQKLLAREFEIGFQLNHPNVVRVIGKGEDQQGPYYFMEFLEGKTLEVMIGKTGLESPDQIRDVAIQLLNGIDFLHSKDIIHRDIKPSNVMVTNGGKVKLIDFGLSKAREGMKDLAKFAGTPKYMASEMKANPAAASKQSDLYAFGVILMEMWIGMMEANSGKLPGAAYASIIKRCIVKDLTQRFKTCSEILTILENDTVMAAKAKPAAPPKPVAPPKPLKPPIPPIEMDKAYQQALHRDGFLDLNKLNIPVPFHPNNLNTEVERLNDLLLADMLTIQEKGDLLKRLKKCLARWEKLAFYYKDLRREFVDKWNDSHKHRGAIWMTPATLDSVKYKTKYKK